MELFDQNSLAQILGNSVTESDHGEVCFRQIDSDLRALCLLLDANEEYVIYVLKSFHPYFGRFMSNRRRMVGMGKQVC